jgi:class 3 adenylate cyclase
MGLAMARHDDILREVIGRHDGVVFSHGGDGFAAAFARASDAIRAAIDGQRALTVEAWPGQAVIHARMGHHTGEAEERDGTYVGSTLNCAARLMAGAHGGQVVVSEGAARVAALRTTCGWWTSGSSAFVASRAFGVEAKGLPWVDRPLSTSAALGNVGGRRRTGWARHTF